MKTFLAILILFGTSFAFANDGSTPYINVQGIKPNGNIWDWNAENPVEKRVEVYGKQTQQLFDALPVADVAGNTAINFFSMNYGASIWCVQSYTRPTTGEQRDDAMCTFGVFRSQGGPDFEEWESDSFNLVEEKSDLGSLSGKNLNALGVYPVGIATGEVFSFYGKQASYVAQNLVGSGLTLKSGAYTVKLACKKNYVGPVSGQNENDYICTVTLKNN
jgi:hypothetical protein